MTQPCDECGYGPAICCCDVLSTGNAIELASGPETTGYFAPPSYTEDGNALIFAETNARLVRYCPEWGRWLVWNGHKWQYDTAARVVDLARRTIRRYRIVGVGAEAEEKAKRLDAHRKKSLSYRSITGTLALARTDPRIVVRSDALDGHPWELNTPDGIVDLTTGNLWLPDRRKLHTRATLCTPDDQMSTPKWNGFLADTFGTDDGLIAHVQDILGYASTGDVGFHRLPDFHGPGGNGKGTITEVALRLLGDYATAAPAKFLMAGREQHETEIARLVGMRLVICSEVNRGDRFDEAKVKLLTGGDPLTARFMRQDHFTFFPTHHLILMCNHQPRVTGGGRAFWRRFEVVPFVKTPEVEIDNLASRLIAEEGPGILSWMITGAIRVRKRGFAPPECVVGATDAYKAEEERLAQFLAERCIRGPSYSVATAALRGAYESWCLAEGETPMNAVDLGRELANLGIYRKTPGTGPRYDGVGLLTDSGDNP